MLDFSREEVAFILRALVEQSERLERMKPHPERTDDSNPYPGLIRRLVTYRNVTLTRGGRKAMKGKRSSPNPRQVRTK